MVFVLHDLSHAQTCFSELLARFTSNHLDTIREGRKVGEEVRSRMSRYHLLCSQVGSDMPLALGTVLPFMSHSSSPTLLANSSSLRVSLSLMNLTIPLPPAISEDYIERMVLSTTGPCKDIRVPSTFQHFVALLPQVKMHYF